MCRLRRRDQVGAGAADRQAFCRVAQVADAQVHDGVLKLARAGVTGEHEIKVLRQVAGRLSIAGGEVERERAAGRY